MSVFRDAVSYKIDSGPEMFAALMMEAVSTVKRQ